MGILGPRRGHGSRGEAALVRGAQEERLRLAPARSVRSEAPIVPLSLSQNRHRVAGQTAPSVAGVQPGIEDLDGVLHTSGAADCDKRLSTSYNVGAIEGV